MKRIEFEEAAELDRLQMVTGEVAQDKNGFVFRDARTGRAVVPHKAGKPGTVRAELRDRRVRKGGGVLGALFVLCRAVFMKGQREDGGGG